MACLCIVTINHKYRSVLGKGVISYELQITNYELRVTSLVAPPQRTREALEATNLVKLTTSH